MLSVFNMSAMIGVKLEAMLEPIMASELPKVKLNLKGIRQYARESGVSIASLTDAEKKLFMGS